MSQKTIAINGIVYDHRTGLPLHQERGSTTQHAAHRVHKTVQRSQTLNRKYVAKSRPEQEPVSGPIAIQVTHRKAPQPALVTPVELPKITKFAPHTPTPVQSKHSISDIGPAKHPIVERAVVKHTATKTTATAQPTAPSPSQVLKAQAIADATARTTLTSAKRDVKPATKRNPFSRMVSLASASLAMLLLGGYLTYLSMPNISTRVAASQAGVEANYPAYKPSGYSLSGPVAFREGAVSMKFAANAGPQSYTLTQARSGWDSSAVLSNHIEPQAGQNYATTVANGLTIYTYDQHAAWVNGGVLYTIDGDAPLSYEQIQRIAKSM